MKLKLLEFMKKIYLRMLKWNIRRSIFCDLAEELYSDEKQTKENDLNMKNAYGKKVGLLEAEEIFGK